MSFMNHPSNYNQSQAYQQTTPIRSNNQPTECRNIEECSDNFSFNNSINFGGQQSENRINPTAGKLFDPKGPVYIHQPFDDSKGDFMMDICWNNQSNNKKFVYSLSDGSRADAHLLSIKGANLCEIQRLGFRVPPAFIVTSEVALDYHRSGLDSLPGKIRADLKNALYELERLSGRMLGSTCGLAPLLLSLRTGSLINPRTIVSYSEDASSLTAAESGESILDVMDALAAPDSWCIPGAKETCHGIGLNDQVVEHLAALTSSQFAYNTYAHFILRYGTLIMGVNREEYLHVLRMFVRETGRSGADLTAEDLKSIVQEFKAIRPIPDDPFTQLEHAICENYHCWFATEAIQYRRDALNIKYDLGASIIVQTMIFGGTGLCISRNPFTGEQGIYGSFSAQDGQKLRLESDFATTDPSGYEDLKKVAQRLEIHFNDMQQFEFIFGDDGVLYVLHVCAARRTAKAGMRVAVDLVRERIISPRESILRLDEKTVDYFVQPQLHGDEMRQKIPFGVGLAASAGMVTGPIVFSSEVLMEYVNRQASQLPDGEGNFQPAPILCVDHCYCDDGRALRSAGGVITLTGNMVCDAAILCRGMAKPCVTSIRRYNNATEGSGSEENFDLIFTRTPEGLCAIHCLRTGEVIKEGDLVSLDGSHGRLYIGACLSETLFEDKDFQTVLSWADELRSMRVEGTINAPAAATTALMCHAHHMGADSFGCISTDSLYREYTSNTSSAGNTMCKSLMLLRCILLATSKEQRSSFMATLCVRQRRELLDIFRSAQGKALKIKLLDTSLETFLPSNVSHNEIQILAQQLKLTEEALRARWLSLKMQQQYEGCRGSKMITIIPELLEMQAHSIIAASLDLMLEGTLLSPTIMVPNVCTSHELDMVVQIIHDVANQVALRFKQTNPNMQFMGQFYSIGAICSNPRMCVRAETLASKVSAVTFNTEELTAHMFGCSQAEAKKTFPSYINKRVYLADPFHSLDDKAVGNMIDVALKNIRETVPSVTCSITEGLHTSDFRSIQILHELGVDSISCHPNKIPHARIGAAQATIRTAMKYQHSAAGLEDMLGSMVLFL